MEFRPDKALTDEQLNLVLVEKEGFVDLESMLAYAVYDSIVPGICPECLGVQDCEPDARANWCDICETQTVRSCLDIAGII